MSIAASGVYTTSLPDSLNESTCIELSVGIHLRAAVDCTRFTCQNRAIATRAVRPPHARVNTKTFIRLPRDHPRLAAVLQMALIYRQ